MDLDVTVSESRTYVAILMEKDEVDGHKRLFFDKFVLPDDYQRNNSAMAKWYYSGAVNSFVKGCIAFEDYQDLRTR